MLLIWNFKTNLQDTGHIISKFEIPTETALFDSN